MAYLVACTEKASVDSPYRKIKAVGGVKRDGTKWKRSIERVINEIESGEQTYYVNVGGAAPNLVVDVHEGVKFLKAPQEKDGPAILLALPDCP